MVIDASALLALVFNEPGWRRVGQVLGGGSMSAVNLAEVLSQVSDRPVLVTELPSRLYAMGLRIVPFDAAQAAYVALLRPATRPLGLSLGDRACLALAHQRGEAVLTADRAWARLRLELEVELIR